MDGDKLRIIADLWPVFLTLVGLLIWAVRLEAKVFSNARITAQSIKSLREKDDAQEKKLDAVKDKHDALDLRVVDGLSRMRESLARIEGHLGVGKHET